MSARWTFVIDEVSAGRYRCEAIRHTHHSVSRDGFDDTIAQLLHDAFQMELQFGTDTGEAAFHVTSGFQKLWRNKYQPELFGSWVVESLSEPHRAVYDGKDFHLVLYRQADLPIWQGHIGDLRDATCKYFRELIYL